jgi:release factor glutamine methyltransferase
MFVTKNTVSAIKEYFFNELDDLFHKTEVESFFYILCEHYLGYSKIEVSLSLDKSMSESELLKFHYAIKDLKKEKPVQLITGTQYFYENEFLVNEHTLIPRPETEELVDLIIKENTLFNGRLLDIGTGSGAIAISLDLKLPQSKVVAFDVSEEAITQATLNNKKLKSEVEFVHQDILNPTYSGELFDIIVSNPPYVLNSEKDLMNKNVLDYEPHLALFVKDNNPLVFYIKIIDFSMKNLKSGGKLYVEINENYGKETAELLKSDFQFIEVIKDINGKDRMVKGTKI